jgi:hypothetical protein
MLPTDLTSGKSRVRKIAWVILAYGVYLGAAGTIGIFMRLHAIDPLSTGGRPRVWPLGLAPGILIGAGIISVVAGIGLLRLRAWARSAVEAYAWLGVVLIPITSVEPLFELVQNWGLRDSLFALIWLLAQMVAVCVLLVLLRSEAARRAVAEG